MTMDRPYEKVPTDKLKFALGIGEAGLKIWKGRRLTEVRAQCEAMRIELKLREGKP